MKKGKKSLRVTSKKTKHQNKGQVKAGSSNKIITEEPDEFEEDQSMNIRMKPQPLV